MPFPTSPAPASRPPPPAADEEEVLKTMAKAMANAREIGPDYETAKRLAWVAYSALIGAGFKIA